MVRSTRRLRRVVAALGPDRPPSATRPTTRDLLRGDRPQPPLRSWIDFLTTKDGDPRGPVSPADAATCADLDALIDNEAARLGQLVERLKTAELFEFERRHAAPGRRGDRRYARLKRQRGVLDFEDLIVKTVALLSRADAARWVQYKLDRGLDHILVDEAQDTSPRQWQVIRALAEEFFAGEGAGAELRTLFAVGDEKQSIYSFQGAVPHGSPASSANSADRPPPAATRGRTSNCIFPSARCRWCSRRSMLSSPTRRCIRA